MESKVARTTSYSMHGAVDTHKKESDMFVQVHKKVREMYGCKKKTLATSNKKKKAEGGN